MQEPLVNSSTEGPVDGPGAIGQTPSPGVPEAAIRTDLSAELPSDAPDADVDAPDLTTDLSAELPSNRTDVLIEPIWVRATIAKWFKFELCSRTLPHSPKGIAVGLLVVALAMLALSGGLGAVAMWLGAPVWVRLTAAGIGLVVCAGCLLYLKNRR